MVIKGGPNLAKHILIVEDDLAISRLIKLNLEMVGYKTTQLFNGTQVIDTLQSESIDLILLDVMLPGINGFDLIDLTKPFKVPIIYLTARNTVMDKVTGLRLGAEDYIVKPFETIELLARIEVVLRRYTPEDEYLYFKDIIIQENNRMVKKYNEPINLTLKEFELFLLLVRNKNRALSREYLLEKIWGYEYMGETRTVDTHVQNLRRKLGLTDHIKTVYKIGYRLED